MRIAIQHSRFEFFLNLGWVVLSGINGDLFQLGVVEEKRSDMKLPIAIQVLSR
ncbi:MAG TPA: hypothetical protein VK738_04400 [Terriglobales bacterium]|nr:hypothetical protein [Terriglobales bacterium]